MTPRACLVLLRRLLLLLAVVPIGCAAPPPSEPASSAPLLAEPAAAPTRWPYWPVRLRFHPLTRVVSDEQAGEHLLEARVEFFDAEGDTTKAAGLLRLDLHDVAPGARDVGPLATWSRDLADPALNREHYDVVTRTYLLRLEIAERDLAGLPELRAQFLGADGRQLGEARARVRTR